MQTKYILHGGFTSAKNKLNAGFYKEMGRYIPNGGTILLVYFSRDEGEYDRVFDQDKSRIIEQAGDKNLNIICATKRNFIEEVKSVDALYMRGGDTNKLLAELKKHPDFREAILGKVVAGSSAGVYVLAKYYYSGKNKQVGKGLGLLPIRAICHYESERLPSRQKVIDALEKYPNNLELVVLRDHEWRTITV